MNDVFLSLHSTSGGKAKIAIDQGEVLSPFGLSLSKPFTFRQAQGEQTLK
jgi:hypothetical protein